MVFALVYKDVYKKTGERAARERGITLSNGKTKIVRIQGGDDDGDDNGDDEAISLFSSPAMPIRSVQTHRGWVLGNISYMQDAAECGKQFTHDETLAETLTRMKDGESLKDAMGRRGSRGINAHKKKGQGSDAAKQKKGQTSTFISPAPPGSRENELDKSWRRADNKKESKNSNDKGLPKSCLKKKTLTRATRRRKGSIKFSNVEVRFYGRTLGDNPACPSGPPISLSWLYRKTPKILGLDEYEARAQEARAMRDNPERFSLSARQRIDLLESLGFAYNEILKSTAMIRRDQIQREQTIHSLKYIYLEESLESCKKFAESMTTFIGCKRRQDMKWRNAAA